MSRLRQQTRLGGRRQATAPTRQTKQRHTTILAPIRGLVLSEHLAAGDKRSARVLNNWFPTTKSARVRGGSVKYATLHATTAVGSMWTYIKASTEKFFAAADGKIFDITTVADPDAIPSADVTGQTSNYYSTIQMGTAGGDYLYAVNGDDLAQIYDGTSWEQVSVATHELPYDAETGTFTVGLTVTGGTSAATGVIEELIDNGTDGTLRLSSVSGTFQDNETITDTSTGSADADIPSGITVLNATITGQDTSTFSFVSKFANRLFFVEKDTQIIHYLGVDAISGAVSQHSMAGVFPTGSPVLYTGRWSFDSGDGMDDRFVVVSEAGDVAVYEGTNPASAADWVLVGVYTVSAPVGFNATMRAGGDFLIGARKGIVPLSEIVQKDVAALDVAAITRNIEPLWDVVVNARIGTNWEIMKWPSNNMMVVSNPKLSAGQDSQCFVANLETGAWAVFTGWDTNCLAHFNNNGYFGTSTGDVFLMESTGSDAGTPYVAEYAGQFDSFGAAGSVKTAKQMRSTYISSAPFNDKLSVGTDYAPMFGNPPDTVTDYIVDQWDSGVWDTALWDGEETFSISSRWRSVGRTGYAISPQIQIQMGITPTPSIEFIHIDMTYEIGGLVV